jgi:hypothetical protein
MIISLFEGNYQNYGQGTTEFYQTKCDVNQISDNFKGLILGDLVDYERR